MVAVFAVDNRVHFREDEGSDFGNGVGGGSGGEEGFPLLKDGGEGHLLGSVHRRLRVTVEAGKARHFRADPSAPGFEGYRSEELRYSASLGEPSSAYISGRSSLYSYEDPLSCCL